MRKFLTARWQDLIMANYEVDVSLLASRLPAGTEPDLHEGRCFVSIVGFMFRDTRVLGIPVPFHVNFEEVNLRFYVTRTAVGETRRGVVFVKEIVPRLAIAVVARELYGEPYECWQMSHNGGGSTVGYSWSKRNVTGRLEVEIGSSLGVPDEGAHGSFIIEHYWGYTRRSQDRTDEYKVEHPKWEIFSVKDPKVEVDFRKTYGDEFAFLNDQQPYSVLLARGSEVAVYKGRPIKP